MGSFFIFSASFVYFFKVNCKRLARNPFRISDIFLNLSLVLFSLFQLSFKLSPEDTISHASRLALLYFLHLSLKLCQLCVWLMRDSFLLLYKKFIFLAQLKKRLLYAEHIIIHRRVVRLLLSLLHSSFLRYGESFLLWLFFRFCVRFLFHNKIIIKMMMFEDSKSK